MSALAAIEAAFRKLPRDSEAAALQRAAGFRNSMNEDQPLHDVLIKHAAGVLSQMVEGASDHPFRPASRKATADQLERFALLADDLLRHFSENLNRPAIGTLGGIGILKMNLQDLAARAKYAATHLEHVPEKAGRSTGQDLNRARGVTAVTAHEYYHVTGRRPSITGRQGMATGQFMELLSAVFKALRIKASPEARARDAVDEWKKRSLPDTP